MRVAARRRRDGTSNESDEGMSNGDDQASYLHHLPVDYLHTWDVFDRRDIIRFTCAQLPDDQGASSHGTPSPTSAGRNSRSNRKNNEQFVQTQRDMVVTVQDIGASIAGMSRANADMGRTAKIRRIDELRTQRYRVALASAASTIPSEKEVHSTFMNELSVQIDQSEREMHAMSNDTANDGASANANRTRGRLTGNPAGYRGRDETWAEYDHIHGQDHPNNRGVRPMV